MVVQSEVVVVVQRMPQAKGKALLLLRGFFRPPRGPSTKLANL